MKNPYRGTTIVQHNKSTNINIFDMMSQEVQGLADKFKVEDDEMYRKFF